jgi:DNA (cytosine-5)-methyltransferase 1
MAKSLTLGSLFAGIGGFELAATWAGITPVWSNEIDSFCCQVLRNNFTHRIIEDDIRKIGKHNLESVDILSGGFPCQPFSTAGRRKGTEDDRYLWPEMLRVIREIQPRWVVGENVSGLFTWNRGLVFEQVHTDLENEGYEVQSFIIPACSKNAPHRRDRVWIVAFNPKFKSNGQYNSRESKRIRMDMERNIMDKKGWHESSNNFESSNTNVTTDATSIRQQGQGKFTESIGSKKNTIRQASWTYNDGSWPTQPPVRIGNDGLSAGLVRSAIESAGNAIVPQVAQEIFKAIVRL